MEKKLLSVRETAELSGVSVDTVYRWIASGVGGRRLPVVNVSTGRRSNSKIRPAALDSFLESLERAA